MNWFWIALSSQALYGISNYIDKYLLGRYFKSGNSGALVIFSALIGVFAAPIIYLIEPEVFNISFKNLSLIVFSGILLTLYLFPYFYALSKDDASIVVPIFQTIPVFSFILALFFLGETLTINQAIGSATVIFGSVGLSLDLREKVKLKKDVFGMMLLASALIALAMLIFKFVAIEESFWVAAFWENVGLVIVGLFLLIFFKSYRNQFTSVIKKNATFFLVLNGLNETINIASGLIMFYATILAPLAVVQTVGGFQPVFVFVYGIILSLFAPKILKENIGRRALTQKMIFISIILLGTFLLIR